MQINFYKPRLLPSKPRTKVKFFVRYTKGPTVSDPAPFFDYHFGMSAWISRLFLGGVEISWGPPA